MRVTTAWLWRTQEDGPEMVAAYDELAFDVWGGVPDWYLADIKKVEGEGEIRTVVIEFDSAAVYDAFNSVTVQAAASPSDPERAT